MLVSVGLIDRHELSVNTLMDFEDTTESDEDAKGEKELKDYKISSLNTEYESTSLVRKCLKFGQFDLKHAMEVFIEVITPPPEA